MKSQSIASMDLKQINKNMRVKNNQTGIVKKAWTFAVVFLVIIMLAVMDLELLPIHPAIIFLCAFLFMVSVVVALIFRNRAKKLNALISGEKVIASWVLSANEKAAYVKYLYQHERNKNSAIFWVISVLTVLIFGGFILFMEEGRGFMAVMMVSLIAFVAVFAFGMPSYYRNRNMKADGNVLIGKKFAYINGFFHNWDYPLSGIDKVKTLSKPFRGLNITYYYTDRTFTNTEELHIPAPEGIDLEYIVSELKDG